MAITYTTVNKVANKLGFPDGYFNGSSTPTTTVIENMIDEVESRIDDETGHSWRATTVTKEYVSPSSVYLYGTGIKFKLQHRTIRSITALEVWDGTAWVDWKATKTEGRNDDYWYDDVNGFVYLVNLRRILPHSVRVTYVYGESTVKASITQLATLMAALAVLNMPEFSVVSFTQSGDARPSWESTKSTWQKEIDRIIDTAREFQ